MKIAVIGAGYAGMACAWHLLHSSLRPKNFSLTIFDGNGLGGGASGIAAGLLHPFVGLHAKKNLHGSEAMAATNHLLKVASQALGQPVYETKGLLRVAMSAEQQKNFIACATLNPEVLWWEKQQCIAAIPSLDNILGGIYIPHCQTVLSLPYLQGLWKSCERQGAVFSQQTIQHLAECRAFDRIVITTGAFPLPFEEASLLSFTKVKGQLIEFKWPPSIPPLPFPVNSQAYVLMTADNQRCLVGATYERDFATDKPDIEVAYSEISPKLGFLPFLAKEKIVGCRAHFRASAKQHLPLSKQLSPRIWALLGFGSKGLLYHSLYAAELSEKILAS